MIGPSDIQIILGKVRPLSRPLTEAHPQVLIIAPEDYVDAEVVGGQDGVAPGAEIWRALSLDTPAYFPV
ncbi:hypothetical protein [[Mycobacterium] burgundiense]|uniref:Uncharacterized protein n=1 Tax=[Mycobacterium] burgundiense TaxID=3064286 RepID=A0ABM9LRW0_9MYCO|nr:hypothetical protein [Mycolicibacterium sp. MU0053]CAJ1503655.1 hypothetical protein MU0053_002490 [Mycolicibacterium sp. MU0053]